eukprot:TRINITY_DN129_c0_g1_i2.p1 TRINITY_DN129_c0_g1~~TRINITY_DN129_c0_g1_i2.p1  ORF type:complete len:127 (-),score=15.79 TRINITY_DN129_c0_g1_i2:79-459(-)
MCIRDSPYTELLWVKKPEFNFGYWGGDNRKGFQHTINAFKFDDTWFMKQNTDWDAIINYQNQIQDKKFYTESDYEELEVDGDGISKILFKNLPENKMIAAFSDMESILQATLGDNHYRFAFKLYVR